VPQLLDLTLVLDIGKSNAKLLLLDAAGVVQESHARANASVQSALGYSALDLQGLQQWMMASLRASPLAARCGHVIACTHGAALVALGDDGLAWDPLDYEFAGVRLPGQAGSAYDAACDPFAATLAPSLPAGLNAARQLHYMQSQHPQAWRKTRVLLPYAQYWAFLLSGVACSEVSSLGCHTQLWQPARADYSELAHTRGWAQLFAPLRSAWEVLGKVTPQAAAHWGLPAACEVHVGVHDSNACLARYFDRQTQAGESALTLVSSGTWTVLMAPGASAQALEPARDMLGNVDVLGRTTPTARFMGGREFAALLQGADPAAASLEGLQQLAQRQIFALPSFAPQGGPFAARAGRLLALGADASTPAEPALSATERASLAACYCAQLTAWLHSCLWRGSAPVQARVVVEGPLAHSALFLQLLQALLPDSLCQASADTLEGTARGAWLLAHWDEPRPGSALRSAPRAALDGLPAYHQAWLAQVLAEPAD